MELLPLTKRPQRDSSHLMPCDLTGSLVSSPDTTSAGAFSSGFPDSKTVSCGFCCLCIAHSSSLLRPSKSNSLHFGKSIELCSVVRSTYTAHESLPLIPHWPKTTLIQSYHTFSVSVQIIPMETHDHFQPSRLTGAPSLNYASPHDNGKANAETWIHLPTPWRITLWAGS